MRSFKIALSFISILFFIQCTSNQDSNQAATQVATAEAVPLTHSFFVAGPQFTGIIGEDGKELWDAKKPAARDGYVLPNGNKLICWSKEVKAT